ncbi:efflux RND transporter permease subunit [Undibacterium luofuense]|uniref:Efflux RND transporter permease subunit n=1 Tax=Undibacterium luofuense TaxID=2828733 RepID=A0A941DMP3_9BURK|nr:efflux RND transporter permease subunit [Undibacterium luofuense]MBR7783703.1 efflux RND transporter permease subunit [Undibacterium luofuense]
MNFSALSIRNPIPAIMLFTLLTLAGLLAFKGNIVQDFPDIELPIVTISASLPGAAPAQLETEVSRKIEDAAATLQGVKNIYSTVLDGVSTTTIEFVLEKPISDAVNEARDAVSAIRADLPSEMRDPVISKNPTAGRPVLIYSVSAAAPAKQGAQLHQMDAAELSWFVDNTVARRLRSITGVGAVKRSGGVYREINVELMPEAMAALNVSAADVSRRLKTIQLDAPGGRGDISGAEQAVRTLGSLKTAEEIAALDISLPDGRQVRMAQIARVSDSIAEPRSLATLDGKPGVGFEILRSKGASEVDVANAARKLIAELQQAYPNVQFETAVNNADPVQENFEGSMDLLYEGALLAVLVVWWFLRDWRATLVSAAALPLSVIPTFLGLKYFGYTLNTVSLLSLALVVGVLVDDAIVEIENIERHLHMGKTPFQAAMEAADEIGMAVIATTFALVAVFLPTAFMGGIPGLFFKQFGWTAVIAILASLVVARLLTPMMAAYILKPKHGDAKHPDGEDGAPDGAVMRAYMRAMQWCLRHRLYTILAALAFFIGSISLVGLLPTGFVPPADRAQTQVTIELPPGSTLAQTAAITEQVRSAVMAEKEVRSVYASVGGGSSGDAFAPGAAAEARRAVMTITTSHHSQRKTGIAAIDQSIRDKISAIPGARFTVGPPDTGVKMQLVLQSEDPVALSVAAKQLERELRTLKGIGNVSSNANLVRPEIIIQPDAARAADLGVTASAIADTVRIATAGDYDMSLSKLNLAQRQVPIRVKLPDSVRADLAQIERLQVPGKNGNVMLAQVATVSMDSGPAEINRLNRMRNVILDVELASRQLGEVNEEARALPALQNLPAGVRMVELGDAQEMQALFASFGIAMLIGVLCIYGVLVLLFKDFLQPVTILAALPLSIGGAFVALLVTRNALSMPSMIGLIMLMGIVTKNSILLVDYAILARERGIARFEALVDACHKRSRPIVMTTIAMGAGMMPLALGMGADPSFRAPMAIAVIGGLITSTLLSLLVVPAVFTYIDDLQKGLAHLFGKRRSES